MPASDDVKPEIIQTNTTTGDIMIRCPGCMGLVWIDREQAAGKVSIQCSNCGYHKTHVIAEKKEAD